MIETIIIVIYLDLSLNVFFLISQLWKLRNYDMKLINTTETRLYYRQRF